jgi:hypothetical protein
MDSLIENKNHIMWKVKAFGNKSGINKSKLYSQINKKNIKFGECFLTFSSELFIFPSPI